MDSNRKRKGLLKGKLVVPFYKAGKPASSTVQFSSKVKPSQSFPSTTSTYVLAQPKPKVSFVLPDTGRDLESLYGVAVDESVDIKAASYISSVQERFKLERVKCQEMC